MTARRIHAPSLCRVPFPPLCIHGNLRHEHGRGAVRNYTEDEGGPFAVGLQGLAANHLKLLWPKATVVSVEGKGLARSDQVWIKKMSESEPR